MIKLPEPTGEVIIPIIRHHKPELTLHEQLPHGHNGKYKIYTESQLKQAMRDVLEEAAKIAEDDFSPADAIRKLKEQL